jgi:phospholipase/lecithinase/hemolysin
LIIFGDSLSDVGNTAQGTFDLYPGRYYYHDRFSNGPVFVEALSTGLGLGPPVHSAVGGHDFAYGGAQTAGTGGLTGQFIRDIDEQVNQFLATRTADPNALFLVYAGANDLINGQANIGIPINNLTKDIGRLVTAGARNFLVPNLPPLGHTPGFNDNPATLAQYNARAAQFNTALDVMLENFAVSNAALTFFQLDVDALFHQALAEPAAFGLTNVIDAAAPGLAPGDSSYNTAQIAPNAHEYLFWDDVHPTATVHAVLADRALAALFPPGDYNRDTQIDAADYVVWRNSFGKTGVNLPADGNGNGQVDAVDFDVWRAQFGATAARGTSAQLAPGESPGAQYVAEPASLLLLALAAILSQLAGRRRQL